MLPLSYMIARVRSRMRAPVSLVFLFRVAYGVFLDWSMLCQMRHAVARQIYPKLFCVGHLGTRIIMSLWSFSGTSRITTCFHYFFGTTCSSHYFGCILHIIYATPIIEFRCASGYLVRVCMTTCIDINWYPALSAVDFYTASVSILSCLSFYAYDSKEVKRS